MLKQIQISWDKFFFIFFAFNYIEFARALTISNYKMKFQECTSVSQPGEVLYSIREFSSENQIYYLTVNPKTLKTDVQLKSHFDCKSVQDSTYLNLSYYGVLRAKANSNKDLISNAGIQSFDQSGLQLTVDLCPSSRHYEERFFDWVEEFKAPLGIAMTAKWAKKYSNEFRRLKSLSQKNANILWINHSYSHPYKRGIDNEQNFLLTPGVQFENEVIANEVFILEQGLIPSIFFRFPGLISSSEQIDKILRWGLIPLGANAWLAKGDKPQKGSVVLLHGNGNEPEGIELFYKYLDKILKIGLK